MIGWPEYKARCIWSYDQQAWIQLGIRTDRPIKTWWKKYKYTVQLVTVSCFIMYIGSLLMDVFPNG